MSQIFLSDNSYQKNHQDLHPIFMEKSDKFNFSLIFVWNVQEIMIKCSILKFILNIDIFLILQLLNRIRPLLNHSSPSQKVAENDRLRILNASKIINISFKNSNQRNTKSMVR